MTRGFQPNHAAAGGFLSRREVLRAGGIGTLGLSLPSLLQSRAAQAAITPTGGKAKSCIVLFLLGAPPQHETWDPKPDAPVEIRGDLGPIATNVPGITVGEMMPLTAKLMDKICALRACSTGDNAHSTSGYAMLTGIPHAPRGVEGAMPGAPNDHPSYSAIVKHLVASRGGLPSAVTLAEIIANDDGKVWPGQDGGFFGRSADPWVLGGDPSQPDYQVQNLAPPRDVAEARMGTRLSLLDQLDRRLRTIDRSDSLGQLDVWRQQALSLLGSAQAKRAFDLTKETDAMRDRYGRTKWGQSVLLARRLVEAGVSLVQVNWPRVAGGVNNGHWDTHAKNTQDLRLLMPRMDQAYSALLEDLSARGLLDETLVVWVGEFGRTPKINTGAGRDHWGNVFSLAMAGGGVRGGQTYGESDRHGGEPKAGRIDPSDVTATIFHCLGVNPATEILNTSGRPLPISRGNVIRQVL